MDVISPDEAQKILDKNEPLSPEQTLRLMRFFKHANDDLVGKIRQLKSELGRVARK